MVKQKIVLKLALDDERKRRKAFKAAVGMSGVTSTAMEGEKIIIVGDGVDPITLTTVLRRSLGYAELLSVSSGDDKKKDGYGAAYGYGAGEKKKDGYGYGGDGGGSFGGKEGVGSKGGGGGGYSQNAVAPITYQQYNAMPSYPVYSSYPAPPAYQHQEQDPGCSIM
ncbi:heavy metal-associated isoprenylated plant protein 6-like [Triticum dicoccoides]|uniref:heavy metal-associated isoprenylated plant protein 6-like n=1 Tax=Triticum dicoccoides TaxID=85692 RepID=UPI000E79DF2B|nr:heavy metal-associated isoprenylated plant protein 6-like [Triticum dicoccoides]